MSKKIDLGPVTAYAIAVANGYEGTKEEWLASLKGDKGDQGEKGEKGDTGPQGPQGPEGPKGEQVQPDLTVNDPNDPRYVKGRTHWSEGSNIVWDGNTEGLPALEPISTYKVSDLRPTKDELIGATVTASTGVTTVITADRITEQTPMVAIKVDINDSSSGEYVLIVSEDTEIEGFSVSAGVWFTKDDAAGGYPTSLCWETVTPLDLKFVPTLSVKFSQDDNGVWSCNRTTQEISAWLRSGNSVFATAIYTSGTEVKCSPILSLTARADGLIEFSVYEQGNFGYAASGEIRQIVS